MENGKDEIEIDLLALALAVWRKMWLVLAMTMIGAAVAFSYAKFLVTPLYEAKAMMYVNNSAVSLGNARSASPRASCPRHKVWWTPTSLS